MPQTTIALTDAQIADLLCAAFEGGVGYWCVITGYDRPIKPRSVWGEDTVYPHVDYPLTGGSVLCQVTDEEDPPELVLDRAAIDRGLALLPTVAPKHLADILSENTDADTGDAYLQLCLLGEIVYG